MSTVTELFEQAKLLSPDEQRQLGSQLLEAAGSETATGGDALGAEEKAQIEKVLLDRIDGPFVPLDDGLAERVEKRALERLKRARD